MAQGIWFPRAKPLAVLLFVQTKRFLLLPIREVSNKVDVGCIGCPFAKRPARTRLVHTEMLKPKGKRLKWCVGKDGAGLCLDVAFSCLYNTLVWL